MQVAVSPLQDKSRLDSAIGIATSIDLLEKVLKLPDCAKGPLEALAGVPQVAHDESVLPAALHRPWTPEVGRRGRPVVHSPKSGRIGKGVRENRLILWRSFLAEHTNAQVHARQR